MKNKKDTITMLVATLMAVLAWISYEVISTAVTIQKTEAENRRITKTLEADFDTDTLKELILRSKRLP